MKKLLLTLLILVTSAFMTYAQFGGEDVAVSGPERLNSESKISVADNGWIYILVNYHKDDYSDSYWRLFRSKDDGINYEELFKFTKDGYNLKSCDLIVTGKNEDDINVWVGMVLENPTTNNASVYVAKYKHDGTWIENAHADELKGIKLYHCAISADYRSPAEGVSSDFFISIAYTGYNTVLAHSFVDYVYSKDAGESFKKELIYTQNGENNLGRIDMSIGSNNIQNWGFVGIVFEMDKTAEHKSNIGFLANYADYDPAYKWANPIKVNTKNKRFGFCGYPKIQWMQDRKEDVMNPTLGEHNFLISYHEMNVLNNYDIGFIHPLSTFKIAHGHTPNLNDFGQYFFNNKNHELFPDLAYDKEYNNYLLTYIDDINAVYRFINFNRINDTGSWRTIDNGVYSTAPSHATPRIEPYYIMPVVDIHPPRVKVCFAWTYNLKLPTSPLISEILADTEWSELSSPPPSGTPYITLTTKPDAQVVLTLATPTDNTPVWIEFAPGRFIKTIPGTAGLINHYNVNGTTLKVHGNLTSFGFVKNVTAVDLSMAYTGIIKSFFSLDNQLATLDVSTLTNLEMLKCNNSELSDLKIGALTKLKELYCSRNNLTSLDVSALTNLISLDCSENDLSALDVSALINLKSMNCSENDLTTLNVSTLTSIESLECNDNKLTDIKIGALTNLIYFSCVENYLTKLDVSKLTNLERFLCGANNLTSLDVSKLTKLTHLYCYKNKLTSLDVRALTNLKELVCNNEGFTTNAIDAIYCDLPERVAADNARIFPIEDTTSPGHAAVLATNKTNAEKKRWKVLYYDETPIPTTGSYVCGTGVNDIEIPGVKVYPNPAHGSAVISMQESGSYTVNLYDLQGKLINRQVFVGAQYKLDIKSLDKGVYLLELETGNGSHRTKLIVE